MSINQPNFKFDLNQRVEITISGEQGLVCARSDASQRPNQYLIHYQNGQGSATDHWWDEIQLEAVKP